ncbi:hypothetical protein [Streptomyces sp. S816]|uniref:hypothetical protein n=1 Tax=Streptomyces sp. S816 TaxID=2283197 RepID=UPI001FFA5504|nr:hypothetical protein [Streptomyces sp. S816]
MHDEVRSGQKSRTTSAAVNTGAISTLVEYGVFSVILIGLGDAKFSQERSRTATGQMGEAVIVVFCSGDPASDLPRRKTEGTSSQKPHSVESHCCPHFFHGSVTELKPLSVLPTGPEVAVQRALKVSPALEGR